MRMRMLLALSIMLGFSAGPAKADPPWGSSYWWHQGPQLGRNVAIKNRAISYLNQWSGLSCKNWARKIVLESSGKHVTIPSNQPAPNDYLWQSDPTGQVVGMSMPIQNVAIGHIVQMRLASGWPHTGIVTDKTSTTVTFAWSNYDSTPNNDVDARITTSGALTPP